MTAMWWYLAGVATLPVLFLVWIVLGFVVGRGSLTMKTTVNGRVTERVWGQR